MVLSILSGCQTESSVSTDPPENNSMSAQEQESTSQETPKPDTTDEEQQETIKARELGLVPAEWVDNLSAEVDFTGFDQLITSLIMLCDEAALATWQENVDAA